MGHRHEELSVGWTLTLPCPSADCGQWMSEILSRMDYAERSRETKRILRSFLQARTGSAYGVVRRAVLDYSITRAKTRLRPVLLTGTFSVLLALRIVSSPLTSAVLEKSIDATRTVLIAAAEKAHWHWAEALENFA